MEAYIHDVLSEEGVMTIFFSGCDFKCPACNVPHLVEFQTGEQMALRDVAARIDEEQPRRIIITGGEPLLQRQALLTLLEHGRTTNATLVVDTNASKPSVLAQLLREGLVDELLVDVKAPKEAFDRVTHAGTFFVPAEQVWKDIEESLRILRRQTSALITFQTLLVPGLLYRKEDLLAIAALLDGIDAEWHLIPFSQEVTLDPRLQGLMPPRESFVENLVSFITKAYPNLRVRAP